MHDKINDLLTDPSDIYLNFVHFLGSKNVISIIKKSDISRE